MKSRLTLIATLLLAASPVFADDHEIPQIKTSPALDKIKQLVGTWKGTGSDMGDGTVEVHYRLSAGGSAVVETISPGTPNEMTSVYFDEGGKLAMTHYCMLGNHPTMFLKQQTPNELKLETGAKDGSKGQPHMDTLDVTFVSPTSMVQKWSMVDPGKEGHTSTFKLHKES